MIRGGIRWCMGVSEIRWAHVRSGDVVYLMGGTWVWLASIADLALKKQWLFQFFKMMVDARCERLLALKKQLCDVLKNF